MIRRMIAISCNAIDGLNLKRPKSVCIGRFSASGATVIHESHWVLNIRHLTLSLKPIVLETPPS